MTARRMARWVILAATLLAADGAGAEPAARQPGVIRWDRYFVPHIYGPDIPTVARGLGYATMELQLETVLNKFAYARGRAAEYFGPGTDGFNVTNDEQVRTYGIPERAAEWAARSSSFQRAIAGAFCDGINDYAARNAGTVPAALRPVLPIVPSDIMALAQQTIQFYFQAGTDNVPSLVAAWRAEENGAASPPRVARRPTASNAWAVAPEKTASGNAMLLGNPHNSLGVSSVPLDNDELLHGLRLTQEMEANLVVGDPDRPSLNSAGITIVGAPFLIFGFNDFSGWSHTQGTLQNADLFQLTLDTTGTRYLYGGRSLPLTRATRTLRVRQPDGSLGSRTVEVFASVHGPVVAFNAARTKALALRVAGLDRSELVSQYWGMMQAKTLREFKAAQSRQQMPFFDTMFADRDGEIFFVESGLQPVRDGGAWSDYYNTIQDGTDPRKLWTQTLPFDRLPQATNPPGGWVGNANNPPWTSALPQSAGLNPANFPAYIAPSFADFRPQHLIKFLLQPGKFTFDSMLAGKMSTDCLLADRILPDLIAYARASRDPDAHRAADILESWDRKADATSVGAALFAAWYQLVENDVETGTISADASINFYNAYPKFTTPWSAARPTTTPNGLDPANTPRLLADLHAAYAGLESEFGAVGGARAPWGAVTKTTLVARAGAKQRFAGIVAVSPLSGIGDVFGPLRVEDTVPSPDLGYAFPVQGDGYVQLIEFTQTGPVGGTLLSYGNSTRGTSRHIADQLPLFDAKTLKPLLRSLAAVRAATVKTEGY